MIELRPLLASGIIEQVPTAGLLLLLSEPLTSWRTSLAGLFLATMLLNGCARSDSDAATVAPPVQAGRPIDSESVYAKSWPGRPGLFKLNEQVILQIPPQFHAFWLQRDRLTGRDLVPRPPSDIRTLPPVDSVGFVMHLPEFDGFTPQNYARDFDEDRIEVVRIAPASLDQMVSGAPGAYGPNVLDRILKASQLRPDDFVSMHDLKCYSDSGTATNLACYGRRDSKREEYMLLHVHLPPYAEWVRYPQMRTTYFSPRYGGLEISWRANMKHFARWRQIDAEVWKKIDAWNIGPSNRSR